VATPILFGVYPEESPITGMRGIGVMPAASLELSTFRDLQPIVRTLVDSVGLGETGIGPGWSLESLGGQAVSNYGDFEQAATLSDGAVLDSVWHGPSGTVQVDLRPRPQWQTMAYVGATAEMAVGFEAGIGGFVPLIQIERLPANSHNADVLKPGDVILSVAGVQGPRMRGVRDAIAGAAGDVIPMRVLRDGAEVEVQVRLVGSGLLGEGDKKAGVFLNYAWSSVLMASPMTAIRTASGESQATIASEIPDGVLAGSRWVSIDGAPISHWRDVWIAMRAAGSAGQHTLEMVIENPTMGREQRTITVPVAASFTSTVAALQWQPTLPSLCFDSMFVVRSSDGNPLRAVEMGVQETWKFIVVTYLTIDRLVRGSVGVDQLHGPVGIVHVGTKVADRGFMYLLFFLGIISINLAVLNFLPLPIVDGGMFLFLVYEKIRGAPPSVGFQNAAMLLGFMLILTAFVVTFYNDIGRLVG
jgi:regulator of sigma E protease